MGRNRSSRNLANERAKDIRGTIKKLLSYLKKYRKSLMIVVMFAILSSAFAIIGPKILGKATTKLFEGIMEKITGLSAGVDFGYITKMLIILVILYVTSAFFNLIQGYIMAGVTQKVAFNLRKSISLKINKMPLKYFDKQTHGDVLSRVTNDVDMVSETLSQTMSTFVSSVATIIGVLIMMFSINVGMTLVTLVVIPISGILMFFIVKKSQKYFSHQQKFVGKINGYVEEMYSGHNIIKVFNRENQTIDGFENINNELYNTAWKANFLSGLMQPIMAFVGNLAYVIVSILGGYLTIKNKIKVGDILSFIQYTRSFINPMDELANIASSFQSTIAAAERVFEFLDAEEEPSDRRNAVKLKRVKGEVDFKNVAFGYDENKIIIKDFSAHIEPGQKVAIVGPTGAGKTTVVKLLMRFYDVNSGAITIDGHDIKDFSKKDLRQILGMVLQDTWLFNGTIMDNIRYGDLKASDEDVIKAAKAAHVDHFIHTLPDAYNMELNEEANNISLGQKQLLTIARAFLADPRILILDEATSSVDTRTEILIQGAMDRLMKNRTSFVIAHRLSTIQDADLILVMNDGDIVEQGKHDELLKKNGFYAKLYNSQFEEEKNN